MPTNVDADTSTQDLVEQVRAVAFATRTLAGSPGDIPSVLAGLAQANRRRMQVYSQVANAQHGDGLVPDIADIVLQSKDAVLGRRELLHVRRTRAQPPVGAHVPRLHRFDGS